MNDIEKMANKVQNTPIIELYEKLLKRETDYITQKGTELLSTIRNVINEYLEYDYDGNTEEMLDALRNEDLATDILCDNRVKEKLIEYFESII